MSQKKYRVVIICVALLTLMLATIFTLPSKPTSDKGDKPIAPPSPMSAASKIQVSVLTVSAEPHQAIVTGYGEVKAVQQLQLNTEVAGKVEWFSPLLQVGEQVKSGTLLLALNDNQLAAQLAKAKTALSEAQLEYEQTQQKAQRAQQQWHQMALAEQPLSDLTLYTPQLTAAKAKLQQAEQELQYANYTLAATDIKAPFNALIVDRQAQFGSYLPQGSAIATLYSTDYAEIAIPLDSKQWQLLDESISDDSTTWPVTLTDVNGDHRWQGEAIRVAKHVDPKTQQRQLIVGLSKPLTQSRPLHFGSYVRADIQGKRFDALWKVPSSALSQHQELWYVDMSGSLAKFKPKIQFQHQGYSYAKPLVEHRQLHIVLRPLSSYYQGMQVTAVAEDTNNV
ncbi:efflux RND transporter periplasmic adaptor subunit [Pseudoalteromonas sp. T1lg65]|uniref:efflux RND transporter periplasmic adaptor subunit n=1 Tax=Pseudoalteromonas sp. T1lg65 TaxID=2077101 RepID=UPI003F79B951